MNTVNLILLILFVLPTAAWGNDECFCLKQDEAVKYHGCWTQQQGPRTVFHCRDEDGNVHKLTDLTGLTRLVDGEEGCDPCVQAKPIPPNGNGPIRGDDDE